MNVDVSRVNSSFGHSLDCVLNWNPSCRAAVALETARINRGRFCSSLGHNLVGRAQISHAVVLQGSFEGGRTAERAAPNTGRWTKAEPGEADVRIAVSATRNFMGMAFIQIWDQRREK